MELNDKRPRIGLACEICRKRKRKVGYARGPYELELLCVFLFIQLTRFNK